MPLSNKVFNKLMLKLRGKYNTILVSVPEFRTSFHNYNKEPYSLGLAADQKPSNPNKAGWLPFFGKMTPFYMGPEKGAIRMNTAVVMTNFYKVKRGYYKIDFDVLTTTPKELPKGMITQKLIEYVEAAVKERPANYLWSHKRWKFEYNEEQFGHLKL
jgi:KDO2-lipid IV(A) lauroyltransferase